MRINVKFGSTEQRMNTSFSNEGDTFNVGFGDSMISGALFWFGTRAEYNALPSINPKVCYCIEEGT